MFDIDWKGLILPVCYLLVLSGTFVTFSTVYRKRKASQSANLAPWFPPHLQRNVYLTLLHMEPSGDEKQPRVPDSVLRAALLRRAVEDIHRIIQIRSAKQACTNLLARGSVGDDLMQRFSRAEKEMEEELRDVVLEANALAPNWGQSIFQSANEIAANAALRARLDEIQAQAAPEKEWWEKRRAAIQRDLLGEEEGGAAPNGGAEDAKDKDAAAAAASSSRAPAAAKATTGGSEDGDGVLVDANTPAAPSTPGPAPAAGGNQQGTPSGSSKKKKGKK